MSDSAILTPTGHPKPRFEAFALKMRERGQRKARLAVVDVLGKGWRVTQFGDDKTDFEVTSKRIKLSVDEAWQATYRLRAKPGVSYAEPVFAAALYYGPDVSGAPRAPEQPGEIVPTADIIFPLLCPEPTPLPKSADAEWSIKDVRVPQAWQTFFPTGTPGQGIVVGHPDTGYSRHPEIVGNLDVARGFDFVKNDTDAEDELEGGGLNNPGHGTGTASVIVSPRGAPQGQAGNAVSGVAPGAKLIPFRVERSVVLVSNLNLARAIERAADAGAHVISISMGGLFGFRLRQAVAYAQRRGVIICAAAGNCVRFVVWPAAYDEVIACAASNADRGIWAGSSRGSKVDVTAPGESVWHATATRAGQPGQPPSFHVVQGSGTSYAVATTAGVAALWLARHGRDNLIQRYGIDKIPFVFNQVLRASCVPQPGWEPGKFGGGLVDAELALAAPLPGDDIHPLVAPAMFLDDHPDIDKGKEDTFAHLFEESLMGGSLGGMPDGGSGAVPTATAMAVTPEAALRSKLAELLNTAEANVPARLNEVGQELAFHLATNPDLYRQFEAALSEGIISTAAPERLPSVAGTAANIESARTALLESGVSPALRSRISGGN